MHTSRLLGVAALLAGLLWAGAAGADTASDRPSAILIFPRILVAQSNIDNPMDNTHFLTDSLIQISNTSNESVTLQCFYVATNGHCSITNLPCHHPGSQIPIPCIEPGEICVPGWTETDFRIILTPRQPIAWRASQGLTRDKFPLDGTTFVGPRGESNAGSSIPPVAFESYIENDLVLFQGELKCIVVDDEGRATDRNAIKGELTQVGAQARITPAGLTNYAAVDRHNGIGIQAIGGDVNDDGVLELGGDAGEYNACPSVLVFDHYFDEPGVVDPAKRTGITLIPCSEDIRAQDAAAITAQFIVFNEFEQRFSTSALVDCWYNRFLSRIDTPDPLRSIFSAGVAGTTFGQTRIRGVQGGLLGVLTEQTSEESELFIGPDASTNMHFQGERILPDRIILP